MPNTQVNGRCLCGSVSYAITGNLGIFQYCHCSRCRKFTGSAFASNILVRADHFKWTQGEPNIGRYELPEAKYFATTFCTKCGSSLPWLSKSGRAVVVQAGTLDDDPQIRPSQNIFYESRACWYEDPEQLVKYQEIPPKN